MERDIGLVDELAQLIQQPGNLIKGVVKSLLDSSCVGNISGSRFCQSQDCSLLFLTPFIFPKFLLLVVDNVGPIGGSTRQEVFDSRYTPAMKYLGKAG